MRFHLPAPSPALTTYSRGKRSLGNGRASIVPAFERILSDHLAPFCDLHLLRSGHRALPQDGVVCSDMGLPYPNKVLAARYLLLLGR